MAELYLIGGGPCGGKSTVAEALGKKYSINYIHCDHLVGEHQKQAAKEKYPVNSYINSLAKNVQPLELIKLSARQELARQEELFFMLIKELRKLPKEPLILEGNCLLPRLVHSYIKSPHKAVWLIPSLDFQNKNYMERQWIPGLVTQASEPSITLHNLVQRDHEFNQLIKEQAKKYDLPYHVIDGSKTIKERISQLEELFELK